MSIGLVVVGLVVSLGGGVVLAIPVLLSGLDVTDVAVLLGLTAAGQSGFLVVAYAYAALAVAIGFSSLLSALGLVPDSVIGDVATEQPTFLVGLAVLSIVLVGSAEEFLFRGMIHKDCCNPLPVRPHAFVRSIRY